MPLTPAGRIAFSALAVLLAAGPAVADDGGPDVAPGPRFQRHAPARHLPPEVRYRDPRYQPPRRLARRFAPPPQDVIHAYLPRYTETPMYNEPPSRFPQR